MDRVLDHFYFGVFAGLWCSILLYHSILIWLSLGGVLSCFSATENKFTHISFWMCANACRRQIPGRHCRVKGQVCFSLWWMFPLALNHVVYHFALLPAMDEVWLPEGKKWHPMTYNGKSLPTQSLRAECRGRGWDRGGFCSQERLPFLSGLRWSRDK